MKLGFIPFFIIFVIGCGTNSTSNKKSISSLDTFSDSSNYALGADLGTNLKDQKVELDYDVFMAGLMDGYEMGDPQLNQNDRRIVMKKLQKTIREKAKHVAESSLKEADEFLKNNKENNPDVKETPTGLQYKVLIEGNGDSPNETDKVRVHYSGRLIDGSQFDSSIERGAPSEFGLNQVIKGWTEGLQLMNVGSKFEFYIHPKIGYGSRPRPKIPANSLLIFEVELLDIVTNK